jgi:membrane-associated phospholipid phosphatase
VRPRPRWLRDAERVDVAIYAAIAATPTPELDRVMGRLTHAADRSGVWLASAGALAVFGGHPGRRAAVAGVSSIAVASTVVNALLKPLARRRRPDREGQGVPTARHVAMPTSRSFPSGHSASAFAFATGVGHVLPREAAALRGLAAAVAYSRVHTGVHYPGDVVLGALVGSACAQAAMHALDARGRHPR